jgi:hypothetical protein
MESHELLKEVFEKKAAKKISSDLGLSTSPLAECRGAGA